LIWILQVIFVQSPNEGGDGQKPIGKSQHQQGDCGKEEGRSGELEFHGTSLSLRRKLGKRNEKARSQHSN
jgi:hypothetical protein